jgi:anti-sigma B factor antagonist
LELSSKTAGDLKIISVDADRIDAAIAIEFKDNMRAQTDAGPKTVILDLSQVNFIDSSGLGAIVAAMKYMGQDRKLILAGLNPNVDKVFRLTRMDSVFSLFATLDGALDELRD